jgi:hypothetical protein
MISFKVAPSSINVVIPKMRRRNSCNRKVGF